jgi:hypothetical protein
MPVLAPRELSCLALSRRRRDWHSRHGARRWRGRDVDGHTRPRLGNAGLERRHLLRAEPAAPGEGSDLFEERSKLAVGAAAVVCGDRGPGCRQARPHLRRLAAGQAALRGPTTRQQRREGSHWQQ